MYPFGLELSKSRTGTLDETDCLGIVYITFVSERFPNGRPKPSDDVSVRTLVVSSRDSLGRRNQSPVSHSVPNLFVTPFLRSVLSFSPLVTIRYRSVDRVDCRSPRTFFVWVTCVDRFPDNQEGRPRLFYSFTLC